MKFLDLQLVRFGRFSDRTLDFGTGEGLHVICGPNEAGKSTALRALTDLLYGVPERTADAHTHKAAELRVGARLETADGRELHVLRRKGRKDTLLRPDETPFDEAELRACLGGITRAVFESMFGLSHEALVKGGRDLLDGHGEVGQSLFGASAGIQGMQQLKAALHSEATNIFKPSGSKPLLNQALARFKDANRAVKAAELKPKDWAQAKSALQEAQGRFESLGCERDALSRELNGLERLRRALPTLRQRTELTRRLEELGDVTVLPDTARDDRIGSERTLRAAEARIAEIGEELTILAAERDEIAIPAAFVEQSPRFKKLQAKLAVHEKAAADLPRLRERSKIARSDARAVLQRLAEPDDLDAVDRLRVSTASRERVRKLGREGERVPVALTAAQKTLASVERKLDEKRAALRALPPTREDEALRYAVARAQRRGDLEDALRKCVEAVSAAERTTQTRLAALGLWTGAATDAPLLPIPPAATRDRFASEFDVSKRNRERLTEKRDQAISRIEMIDREIASLAAAGAIPTEEDLAQSRLLRDSTWSNVRAVWLEDAQPLGASSPTDLAARYEDACGLADNVGDKLRYDADRVARHENLRAEREACRKTIAELDNELQVNRERATSLEAEWTALWQPCQLTPLPPTEMAEWVAAHARLVESVGDLEEAMNARRIAEAEVARFQAEVERELAKLDAPRAPEDESFAALLDRAAALLAEIHATTQQRSAIEQTLLEAESDRAVALADLEDQTRARAAWQEKHTAAMTALGMPPEASAEEADAILRERTALFEHLHEAQASEQRAANIARDAEAFAEFVRELVDLCAPDLAASEPEMAAAALIRRYEQAVRDQDRRDGLEVRIGEHEDAHREQLRGRDAAQRELDLLCEQAACQSADQLPDLEERSNSHRELSRELRTLEVQLSQEGSVASLEAEATGLDPDQLPARIERLRERITESDGQRNAAMEEVGGLKGVFAAMDGSEAAVDASTEAEAALADMQTLVDDYVRARLASLVLDRGMKSFAEEHQGELLRLTGEIFARITLGGFERVVTGFGSNDEIVVLCERGNGERVPVAGLSDGTRDQLYLALRIAALERHLDRAGAFPLVVDDILVHFDDGRSRATLEVLAELGERTQVLFFTHHDRLLEIARDAVPASRLREHRLEAA